MSLGFIGLGNVGEPMAVNLLAKGFDLIGYDIRPNAAFAGRGGRRADRVEDVAAASVIIQSLPTVAALEETIEALLPVLRSGHVIIDISSYPLAVKQAQARRVAERGAILLDCEISGLPHQVAERKAVIFKSGDAEVIERLHAVFEAMAGQHFYLGEFGAATKMKLIANTMVCVHNLMAAEALNLATRAGLDPAAMVDVLTPSAAGSATFANKAPLMLARAFRPGRGPFRHMFGYLARTRELAEQCGASMPLLRAAEDVYRRAESEGRHDQDIAAILELLEPEAEGPMPRIEPTSHFVMLRRIVDPERLPATLSEHLQWLTDRVKDGTVLASGPAFRADGSTDIGLTILRTDGFEAAEMLASRDPFCREGIATFEVHRWEIRKSRDEAGHD